VNVSQIFADAGGVDGRPEGYTISSHKLTNTLEHDPPCKIQGPSKYSERHQVSSISL
jgi:hypothetical protein